MKKIQAFSSAALLLALTGCTPCDVCEPCGDVAYYHQYGVQVDPDYWNVTGRNGEVVTTLRDGSRQTQTYQGGVLHGQSTLSYPFSEQTKHIEHYEGDVCVKKQTFLECGTPDCSTEYNGDGTLTLTQWYNCGTPRCIEKYADNVLIEAEYLDPQNNRESWVYQGSGERAQRDRFGQFQCLDSFENGYLAKRTYYHPNGSVSQICPYDRQGNITGLVRTYYPDGSPNSIETWCDNCQNGTTIIFQNGEKCAEVPYISGKKHGLERRYIRGEIVSQEITWYENYMHGPCYTYNGDSVQTEWYYRGKVTTRSNYESYNMPRRPIN